MSNPRSVPQAEHPADRVLVVASPARALDLLRLAVLRSDDVLFVAETVPADVRRAAGHHAVELAHRAFTPRDLRGAAALLVSLDDREGENRIVRQARRWGVPVHVAGRPLLSDFSLLAMLEHPGTPSRAAA